MNFRWILAALLLPATLFAKGKKGWDVENPGSPQKEVSFTVDEGTWMNLDVSPDGKQIVFDLLGDIYIMPISGGKAKVLRQGKAMEVQPRFSPDGKKISFTSDAGGGDNVWVMDVDGKNARQITKESFRLLNNGVWTPDGMYIIARKHFTSTRSLGAGEMWMYHIRGGKGLQLTKRKNDQQDVNEPCVSPDGRYVYFSEDMYPGGHFQYNKDPNSQIFVIKRFDREEGKVEKVTGGPGGAVRPQISHNGKLLAFVKRVRTKSVLFLRNIETGEEWPIYDELSKDQQEAWTTFGIYPGFSWMPDDQHIVIWAGGKIKRIDVNAINSAKEIPFTCDVKTKISEVVRFGVDVAPSKFTAHVISGAVTAPDGKWMVFSAVGHLYKMKLPNGKPTRITDAAALEYDPSFAPDGQNIVYVTWSDAATGSISRVNIAGGTPEQLTKEKGIYRTPSYSPDGKYIVYEREHSSNTLGPAYTAKPGIYMMPANGGEAKFVTNHGSEPKFSKNGERIYYQTGGGLKKAYKWCKTDGEDERTLFTTTYAKQFTVSPDEQWIAYSDLHQVYVAAFPHTGKPITIGSDSSAFPVRRVSADAGYNLHWSKDSKELHYTLGTEYYTVSLDKLFEFVGGKPDSTFAIPTKGATIKLEMKADKPKGAIAFTNARIITMDDAGVIEDGTIIIEENRITAVGKVEDVVIPRTANVINCKGKTIMPGFIDAHAHAGHFYSGIVPEKHWPYYANLAYGVTTMHDPSANSEFVFALSEMQKAGLTVGPRVFSTGTILYGADGDFKAVINSLADAKSAISRTAAFGANSVKSYNQPRRNQRQMVIEAARELKINVVPEGGSFFYHNLSMIIDGHTTIEHNIPVAPLYKDVVNLWKRSGTANTPTLVVSYGSLGGEYYWYQHTNVWEKERLLRFTPRPVVDTRSRHRTMAPEEEYENGHILVSKSLKKLTDAGVLVNMGAHGQLQGLGAHWEIWMMAQGGMTPMQALQTATINPAKSLGYDAYIGSLTEGKLADLLILDKNPLDDIYNTESIRYTMVNGRLYDAETMDEIGNYNKPAQPFYWKQGKNAGSFPWYEAEGHLED